MAALKPGSTSEETKKQTWPTKLGFLTRCMLARRRTERPSSPTSAQTLYDNFQEEAASGAGQGFTVWPIPYTSTLNDASPALSEITAEPNVPRQLCQFSYAELKHATRNFAFHTLLGEGGFGRVYKGWVNESGTTPVKPGTGLPVAVKSLNPESRQGHREWLAEVNYLSVLHHPNLVKLVGYCMEGDKRMLVYEFMARGSLESHLFRRCSPLPWHLRIKIVLDAAKGLSYLHEEAGRPVIFRDFKASNVLLDAYIHTLALTLFNLIVCSCQEFNAKLSDFGLAKDGPQGDRTHVSTRVMGTYGYAAPEYVLTGRLTSKSDVYSFGIVLLELLTGRPAVDKRRPKHFRSLLEWAVPYMHDRNQFLSLMDPFLDHCFPVRGAQQAIRLAARCIQRDPSARPHMSEAATILKTISELTGYPESSPLVRFSSPRSSF
uniref:non-specific serine/threonine protein kinase n=1 Tax=Kalanchoe fedtschenkoi TaxID=63787 RepID=A0A7N0V1A9_KALFE